RRRAKVLLRIGQACERAGDWPKAERAYRRSSHPGARHRLMRVYERTGRFADALSLALAAAAAPESDEEYERVARMLPRLRRRLGVPGDKRAACLTAFPAKLRSNLELDPPREPATVEPLVRDHWHSDAAPV